MVCKIANIARKCRENLAFLQQYAKLLRLNRVVSSVGLERLVYTQKVTGSTPVPPTIWILNIML